MTDSLDADGPARVIIHLELDIGTVNELGLGGLKQGWVDSTDDRDRKLSITAGAGVGSPLLEASITDGKDHLYARADIHQFGSLIFRALTEELEKRQKVRDER
jgi:hypothetical protein